MKSGTEILKKEFSYQNLRLTVSNYMQFYQSQWQRGNKISIIFVIYKVLLALIFSTTLILSVVDLDDIYKTASLRAKWLIYLTNWQYSICTLQTVLSAYLVTSMYINARRAGEYMQLSFVNQRLCGIFWATYTIAINGALLVSFVYWTMVYDEKLHSLSVINIFTHAINAALLLIDCFVVAFPLRLLHVYLPVCFNLIYIAFNVAYYLAGGTDKFNMHYIYGILNWRRPLYALKNIFFMFIFVVILHILIYFLVCLRQYLARITSSNETQNEIMSPMNPPVPSPEEIKKAQEAGIAQV